MRKMTKAEGILLMVRSIIDKAGGPEKVAASRNALQETLKVEDPRRYLERISRYEDGSKTLIGMAILGMTLGLEIYFSEGHE